MKPKLKHGSMYWCDVKTNDKVFNLELVWQDFADSNYTGWALPSLLARRESGNLRIPKEDSVITHVPVSNTDKYNDEATKEYLLFKGLISQNQNIFGVAQ